MKTQNLKLTAFGVVLALGWMLTVTAVAGLFAGNKVLSNKVAQQPMVTMVSPMIEIVGEPLPTEVALSSPAH